MSDVMAAPDPVLEAKRAMDKAGNEYRRIIPSGDVNATHAAFERWDAAARDYERAKTARP